MIIRNMRWGYDGGGFACGPVPGSCVVEIMVTDTEEEHNYFVCEARMCESELILVSPFSLLDTFIHANHHNVDMMYEDDKAKDIAIEQYDCEYPKSPEGIDQSRFADVIQLVRFTMEHYCNTSDDGYEAAEKFIAPYLEKDTDELEIPDLPDAPEYHLNEEFL